MLKLIGILIVVAGLALKQNPVTTVFVAGLVTGLVAGVPIGEIFSVIGKAFVDNRSMLVFILTLPAIGLLERHGLKEYSAMLIGKFKAATPGRVSWIYLLFRQISSALGLRLGGHPVFVRPLVAPMAEGALYSAVGKGVGKDVAVPPDSIERVRAMTAAAENYANFFGQNIFPASAGLLLIKGVLDQAGHPVDLGTMALYSIPAGVFCFILATIQFNMIVDKKVKANMGGGGCTK